MLGPIRILNFDDSVTSQDDLLKRFQPIIVDLTHLGPACRMAMGKQAATEIRRVLKPELKHAITFLGSGDFHQVSSVLIEQFDEPLSVIVFDHHPDWDLLPPKLHCGSWVTNVLRRPNIKKLLLIGVSSEDISTFRIQTGNVGALKDDRVEIYPYRHPPTRTFFRHVPENRSIQLKRGMGSSTITWRELDKEDATTLFGHVLQRLPTKQVYVSIDKDCLRASASLTNWEEGYLALEELLRLLALIHTQTEIVGLDLVGDYSPPHITGWLKAAIAHLDRPRDYSAKGKSQAVIDATNAKTNISILECFKPQLATAFH